MSLTGACKRALEPYGALQGSAIRPFDSEFAPDSDGGMVAPFQVSSPRAFGRYRLHKKLASGWLAETYAANSAGVCGFEKWLQVKIVHERFSASVSDHRLNEGLEPLIAAAHVFHPAVQQIFDIGECDGRFYVGSEIGLGQTAQHLQAKRAAGPKPKVQQATLISLEICRGIEAVHNKETAHGAVWPGNVLLRSRVQSGRVRLQDLGIAQLGLQIAWDQAPLEKQDYMAPEVLLTREMQPAGDIFGVGAVLFFLLTGRPPGPSSSRHAVLSEAAVPGSLIQIVLKALSPAPERRYSAAELAGALAECIDDEEAVRRDLDELVAEA